MSECRLCHGRNSQITQVYLLPGFVCPLWFGDSDYVSLREWVDRAPAFSEVARPRQGEAHRRLSCQGRACVLRLLTPVELNTSPARKSCREAGRGENVNNLSSETQSTDGECLDEIESLNLC